ncbi:zinc-ribbon domain containing protein [Succinimonas sp.]|uniref:zinc-ribbon domain containing protein n=1 Tax=Succinimonas sp. TaxID=1936151 RepID=UPI0038695FE0
MGRYDDNYEVLEELFKDYKVFIDTCSLLINNQKPVDEVFDAISKLSREYHNKLVVADKVIQELKRHLKGDDPKLAARAKRALMILTRYDGCFDVFGDKRERRFADIVFLKVFQAYHEEFNRVLITQDYNLSVDILRLMNQKSVAKYMKQIKVFKFDERGYLTEFKPLNNRENRYQPGSFANNRSQSFKQNNNFNQIANAEERDNRRHFSNNSSDNFNPRQSYNKKSDYNNVRQDNSEKSNAARPDGINKKQVSGKIQNVEAIQNNSPLANNSVNVNKINYGWQNNAFSSLDSCHGLDTGFSIYKDQEQNEKQSDDAYPTYDGANNRNDGIEHSQNNSDLFAEQDDDEVPDFNDALVSGDSEKDSILEEIASAVQDNGNADNTDNDDGEDDDSKQENTSNSDNDVSGDDIKEHDDTEDDTKDAAEFSDNMNSDNIEEVDDSDVPEDVLDTDDTEETDDSDEPESENASSESKKNATGNKKPQSKYQEYKARFEASLRNYRYTKVTKVPDAPVPVKELPGVNSVVYADQSEITLTSEISRGGEGIIYSTNTEYVAKIYKSGLLTEQKIKKIELLLSKKLKYEGICFPCSALYNQYHEFVGYLMPRASGKELQRSLFIKPLFLQNFPNWQKIDLVKLCITILLKIRYLHQHGIIMGDINPMNILVVSPEEVYFVDTDSYQVNNFPCPVGTINYTAPEIQRKEYRTFLRTFGNEHFAVATLLFMIMMPGKPPYSQQGGGDAISNIINMDFSYPLGGESNGKTPDGPWRFIWSHLLYKLKEAFYETFKKDGKYSTEDTRLNVLEWLSIFKNYKKAIETGLMDKDTMSLTLFPTRYKIYITEDGEKVIHKSKNTGYERKCSQCGYVFQITEKDIEDCINNGKDLPSLCNRCASGAGVYKTITCCDCGKRFTFTQKEYKFYEEKEYSLPKRCPSCRATNRRSSGWKSYDGRSYGGGRRDIRDNKGCFLNMLLFGLFLH